MVVNNLCRSQIWRTKKLFLGSWSSKEGLAIFACLSALYWWFRSIAFLLFNALQWRPREFFDWFKFIRNCFIKLKLLNLALSIILKRFCSLSSSGTTILSPGGALLKLARDTKCLKCSKNESMNLAFRIVFQREICENILTLGTHFWPLSFSATIAWP